MAIQTRNSAGSAHDARRFPAAAFGHERRGGKRLARIDLLLIPLALALFLGGLAAARPLARVSGLHPAAPGPRLEPVPDADGRRHARACTRRRPLLEIFGGLVLGLSAAFVIGYGLAKSPAARADPVALHRRIAGRAHRGDRAAAGHLVRVRLVVQGPGVCTDRLLPRAREHHRRHPLGRAGPACPDALAAGQPLADLRQARSSRRAARSCSPGSRSRSRWR